MPKKITQYMSDQIASLAPGELCDLIDKIKLTPEVRKQLLQHLGDIDGRAKEPTAKQKEFISSAEPQGKPKIDTTEKKETVVDLIKSIGHTPILSPSIEAQEAGMEVKVEVKKSLPKKTGGLIDFWN
jgi:hypothetical protein